jgi:hypothetical protein
MGDAINLRDAPRRFLSDDWLRLVELMGSESRAIEALSRPEPPMFVVYRRDLMQGGGGSAEVRAAEEEAELLQKMIADLRALAASGQIIVEGSIWGRASAKPSSRSYGRA